MWVDIWGRGDRPRQTEMFSKDLCSIGILLGFSKHYALLKAPKESNNLSKVHVSSIADPVLVYNETIENKVTKVKFLV